ncbi:hypothetical protein KC19_7G132500 [Ceratodon purpureus]|uniref:S1 motif domain-containing protein n=1 Tax=Ceratodon purpureus TaxID=3225 RepID=A0A8T0H960_CERPU|nr:hypothetical protein KC19_7G132500 [Ceratodon purpureus]KAG0567405.1 hypothetical protein KC19_7G132500 [Ceratodon purpureus]
MLARTCIPEWQGLTPGRYRSIYSPQRIESKGRNLALRGFSAYEIRLRTLKWFAGYAKSNIVAVHNKEFNLGLDYGATGSRTVCSDGGEASLGENVAVNSVLDSAPIVNRSLDYVRAADSGEVVGSNCVSRLERSNSSSCSVEEAGFVSLDCFSEDDQVAGNVSAQIGDGTAPTTELGLDDLEYYVPEIGHRVLGVVVSGSRTKFDIDIGAAQLGELKVTHLFPLDRFEVKHNKWICPEEVDAVGALGQFSRPPHGRPCMVYDEEVFGYEDPALFIIDIGTVLELVVIGLSLRGNPVLSVRRAAQRIAWDRVKQMKELNQPILIEVVGCNTSGVLAKVEGLRAFLPLKEFVNRPKTLEDYLGRKLWVTVTFADEVCYSLVISERKAWVKRNLQPGSLHDGTVIEILPYGVRVQVNRTNIMYASIPHFCFEDLTMHIYTLFSKSKS